MKLLQPVIDTAFLDNWQKGEPQMNGQELEPSKTTVITVDEGEMNIFRGKNTPAENKILAIAITALVVAVVLIIVKPYLLGYKTLPISMLPTRTQAPTKQTPTLTASYTATVTPVPLPSIGDPVQPAVIALLDTPVPTLTPAPVQPQSQPAADALYVAIAHATETARAWQAQWTQAAAINTQTAAENNLQATKSAYELSLSATQSAQGTQQAIAATLMPGTEVAAKATMTAIEASAAVERSRTGARQITEWVLGLMPVFIGLACLVSGTYLFTRFGESGVDMFKNWLEERSTTPKPAAVVTYDPGKHERLELVAYKIFDLHYRLGKLATREECSVEGITQPEWNTLNQVFQQIGLKGGKGWVPAVEHPEALDTWAARVRLEPNGRIWVKPSAEARRWVDLSTVTPNGDNG